MTVAKQTLRTRLLMAGAFVGAVLALSLSWAFAWEPAGEQPSAQELAREAAFHAPPGSCLSWRLADAADAHLVPCEQPHLFEVTSVEDLSAEYPPTAPPPGLEAWRQLAEERCLQDAEAYLGGKLDPHGKFSVNLLRPDTKQWTDGERQVRCGLQRAGPGGGLEPITGRVTDQGQSDVWEPGTCLAIVGKGVGDPVDCAKPHSYEIVATLDLATQFKFTEGYPPKEDQSSWLDKQCNAALQAYTGSGDAAKELKLGWDLVEEESWLAGSTKVNCKVGAVLEDDSGLAPVTGSVGKSTEPSTGKSEQQPTSEGG